MSRRVMSCPLWSAWLASPPQPRLPRCPPADAQWSGLSLHKQIAAARNAAHMTQQELASTICECMGPALHVVLAFVPAGRSCIAGGP